MCCPNVLDLEINNMLSIPQVKHDVENNLNIPAIVDTSNQRIMIFRVWKFGLIRFQTLFWVLFHICDASEYSYIQYIQWKQNIIPGLGYCNVYWFWAVMTADVWEINWICVVAHTALFPWSWCHLCSYCFGIIIYIEWESLL